MLRVKNVLHPAHTHTFTTFKTLTEIQDIRTLAPYLGNIPYPSNIHGLMPGKHVDDPHWQPALGISLDDIGNLSKNESAKNLKNLNFQKWPANICPHPQWRDSFHTGYPKLADEKVGHSINKS